MIDHPDELTQYLVVDEKTYHNYWFITNKEGWDKRMSILQKVIEEMEDKL